MIAAVIEEIIAGLEAIGEENHDAITRERAAKRLRGCLLQLRSAGFILSANWKMDAMQRVRLIVPAADGEVALALFEEKDGWGGVAADVYQRPRNTMVNGSRIKVPALVQIIAERPV